MSTPTLQKIKEVVNKTVAENGVAGKPEVYISLVNKAKMRELVAKYYDARDTSDHPVLAFAASEDKGNFVYPPGKKYLGEIIIASEGKSKEEILDLAVHGTLHLVGIHHK